MKSYQPLTPKLALRLAAPPTWLASIYPALFGEIYCLVRGYPLTGTLAVLLFGACILMQAAVNTFNDYFDFVKGTDTAADAVEVSDAVLVYEGINPQSARNLGLGFLLAAGFLALPAILMAGWVPLVIGLFGAAVVWCYSGGKIPISYLPLGEFTSGFVMGGLIPLGIAAAVTGTFIWAILPATLPLIISIGLIMLTNNTSDIEKDRKAGRRTLAALWGRPRTVRLYHGLVALWLLLAVALPVVYLGPWGLVSLLALCLFARSTFTMLVHLPFDAPHRVQQMKTIAKANLLGNAAYLLPWLIFLLGGGQLG